jgi:anti-sigma B factor antagonist
MKLDASEVRYYASGEVAVIQAPASFDVYSAPVVRDLTIRLQRDGAAGIVIDLSAVAFMDATSLGVILGAQLRLRRAGRWLAVAAASHPAARMLRITGLTRRVPVHPAVADAIRAW